ncbi:MAG: glycogen debranching enzyme family protein [Actinobacteria bacterium]|nr:glycogen debranching enzyme family protein [Actinomycetota bacterium]
MLAISFGRETLGSPAQGTEREWLVADGTGGFAMGTISGLRTRRYHGLLVVATRPPIGRMLGLAALDPVLVLGDRRVRLGVHEWGSGAVDPAGHLELASFELDGSVPRWRWQVGDVVLEREVAAVHGRPAVGVAHRVVRAPGPVRLELSALCTWRDVHGERLAAGDPEVGAAPGGFVFEGAYRVRGPGFSPGGAWYRDVRYREEAARGLADREDLWFAGTFVAELSPGEVIGVEAWAGDLGEPPPPAEAIVGAARDRAREVAIRARASDDVDETLALAADRFVVAGPTVVAGYPWFGDWSRDTMTSYEGLFLATNRWEEGRALLSRGAEALSEGMLANTADAGGTEYNTADGTLWFLHAVGRHVDVTGDLELGEALAPALTEVIERHVAGTRFGIGVDPADGLLEQGAEGWALTWMDARVDGRPVTARAGKAVEVNALWIEGLAVVAGLRERLGLDASRIRVLEDSARRSFRKRFLRGGRVLDVVDGPYGDSAEVRPNQLLAVSLPHAPLAEASVVRACAPLLTSLGLRSLSPDDDRYAGRHRGGPADRDAAYHQGTVWPWLIGPYVEAALRTGVDASGVLHGLEVHLGEWGLGSVSETADGDPPHAATGCPFQAWSVAEVLRARRLLAGR